MKPEDYLSFPTLKKEKLLIGSYLKGKVIACGKLHIDIPLIGVICIVFIAIISRPYIRFIGPFVTVKRFLRSRLIAMNEQAK